MRLIILYCLCSFLFIQTSNAQRVVYADLDGLKMVKNEEDRAILLKEWEKSNRLTGTAISPTLIHEGETTLYFETKSGSIGKLTNCIYAFDKKTFKAKYAQIIKISMRQMVFAQRFIDDDMYIFYITAKKEKGKKGQTINLFYAKNDEPLKKYLDYEENSRTNKISIPFSYGIQKISTSLTEEHFIFAESDEGKEVRITILDKDLEKKQSFEVSLPKGNGKPNPFTAGLSPKSAIAYQIHYDDENEKIYFIDDEVQDEKNRKLTLELLAYDLKTQKLSPKPLVIDYEKDLGLHIPSFFENKRLPHLLHYLYDNHLYVIGTHEPDEKTIDKYKDIDVEIHLKKFDLTNGAIIKSSKKNVPVAVFETLQDSKSGFKKLNAIYGGFGIAREDNEALEYVTLIFRSESHNSQGQTTTYISGKVGFAVENDELQSPIALPVRYEKKPVSYNDFGKNYYLTYESKAYTLSQLENNELKEIETFEAPHFINLKNQIAAERRFLIYKSKGGLVKISLE